MENFLTAILFLDIWDELVELWTGCNGCVGGIDHYFGMYVSISSLKTPARLNGSNWEIFFFIVIIQAASNGKFLDACLDMLVCNFLPAPTILPLLSWPQGLARKEQVLDLVHSALQSIADLVPLAPLRLLPIVLHRMPRVHAKEAVSINCLSWFIT